MRIALVISLKARVIHYLKLKLMKEIKGEIKKEEILENWKNRADFSQNLELVLMKLLKNL